MGTNKTARIEISGRVQGVGFRYFVYRTARGLGLSGWVRNRPNGTVEVLFSGDEDAIRNGIKACKVGPLRSHVDQVYVDWQNFDQSYDSFDII